MKSWKVPKLWNDGECWIIGGGTSMARQFGIPEQLINDVSDGKKLLSEYSPYLSQLHEKNTIGINAAFLLGKWMKVAFFGDKGFFTKNKNDLARFGNLKVTCADAGQDWLYERVQVKFMKRDTKKEGISQHNGQICWNYNSGAASISLAAHFGVRRIYLLGFDMRADKKSGRTHWHGHYKGKIRDNTFKRHLKGFGQIVEDANKMGIEIINVNPDSAIIKLTKVSLKDVL